MTIDEIRDEIRDLTDTNSSSSFTDAKLIRRVNLAFDKYQNLVKKVAGTWQADDSNHTKYPNMTFNLVSGQQDYNFTVDEQGNQVQDIYRVEMKDSAGRWVLLTPYDEMSEEEALGYRETLSGTPTRYYKTANGIFLDLTPDYNSTNGIRMWYTRSPDYFLTSDTTKEPGIPNGHHLYLAWVPSYWYWLPKDTQRASLYATEIKRIEDEIKQDIADRKRDEQVVLTSEAVNPV